VVASLAVMDVPAARALAEAGLAHEVVDVGRSASLEEHAAKQGIEPDDLIKTLVVRRGEDDYLFVLVPGTRALDWVKLRGHLGISRVSLPDADEAYAATGYERGTITPLGARRSWPVIADAAVAAKATIALGSGVHGVSVHVDAGALLDHLGAAVVDVTKLAPAHP
jgi:Cys-tRNA(Pro)/Cys-tRNA(Cys) deacylase